MRIIILMVLILITSLAHTKSLQKKLQEFSASCSEQIINGYEMSHDVKPTSFKQYCETCIEDAENGYLLIQGSWPTCGCACYSQAGGFRKSSGGHTLIKYETSLCENRFGIYSNEPLEKVMPENLSLSSFGEILGAASDSRKAYFYLHMDIPRLSTDTLISIKPYPLGQIGTGAKGIAYNTENSEMLYPSMWDIKGKLLPVIKTEKQLYLIIGNQLDQLPKSSQEKIYALIGDNKAWSSSEDLIQKLKFAEHIYQQSMAFEYTQIMLSWDKKRERFFIKNKLGQPDKISFLEFLQTTPYLSFYC